MGIQTIECPKCAAKNRISAHFDGRKPICGRCGTALFQEHREQPIGSSLKKSRFGIFLAWLFCLIKRGLRYKPMCETKRIGILFIIVGFFIPLVLYPFTKPIPDIADIQIGAAIRGSGYSPRLNELEVVFREAGKRTAYSPPYGKLSLRYHYFIAIGITSIFVGISIIVLSGKKNIEE